MIIKTTGHAEIDQQHAILANLLKELANFCSEKERNQSTLCSECPLQKTQSCISFLNSLCNDLKVFLIGHNTYEERLMELLPNTPECLTHVKGHKEAHSLISSQLNSFSAQITEGDPQAKSALLLRLVSAWVGNHTIHFDASLAKHLENAHSPEIDFDDELVAILDKYVFHNRPIRLGVVHDSSMKRLKKKRDIQRRFELLSPAQRKVFWLAASGKTNKEIGSELGITINTVKTHRAAIFKKMDVKTVLELVQKAEVLR